MTPATRAPAAARSICLSTVAPSARLNGRLLAAPRLAAVERHDAGRRVPGRLIGGAGANDPAVRPDVRRAVADVRDAGAGAQPVRALAAAGGREVGLLLERLGPRRRGRPD